MDKALAAAMAASQHYKAVAADPSVARSRSEFLGANVENVPDYANAPGACGGFGAPKQSEWQQGAGWPGGSGGGAPDGGAPGNEGFGPSGGGGFGADRPPTFGRRGSGVGVPSSAALASGGMSVGMGAMGLSGGGLAPSMYAQGLQGQVDQRRQGDPYSGQAQQAQQQRLQQMQMQQPPPMHGRRASRDNRDDPMGGAPPGMQPQQPKQADPVAGYMAHAMGNLSMDGSAASRRGMTPTGGAGAHEEHSVASLRQRQMTSSIF
jgi:hypothetical protein